MPTTADYLEQLGRDKAALADNLVTKGVDATPYETFTTLVPKVLEIEGGGGEDIGAPSQMVYNRFFLSANAAGTSGYPVHLIPTMIQEVCLTGKMPDEITNVRITDTNSYVYGSDFFCVASRYYTSKSNNPVYTRMPVKNLEFINFDFNNLITLESFCFNIKTTLETVIWDKCCATKISSFMSCFSDCSNLKEVTIKDSRFEYEGLVDLTTMFQRCTSLKKADLSGFTIWPSSTAAMFEGCSSLEHIDISSIDCSVMKDSSNLMYMFDGVPTSCRILVRDTTNAIWLKQNFPSYTFAVKGV